MFQFTLSKAFRKSTKAIYTFFTVNLFSTVIHKHKIASRVPLFFRKSNWSSGRCSSVFFCIRPRMIFVLYFVKFCVRSSKPSIRYDVFLLNPYTKYLCVSFGCFLFSAISDWNRGKGLIRGLLYVIMISGKVQPGKSSMAENKTSSENLFWSRVCVLLFIILVCNAIIINSLQLFSNTWRCAVSTC